MTKITINRSVVEQALEALEWHYRQGHSNTLGGLRLKINEKTLRNLKAALAEPQEPVQCADNDSPWLICKPCAAEGVCKKAEPQEPDSPERRCGGPGCDMRCCQPVQEPVAWMRVIDEAMVTHHLGVADPGDDYETAKRKMNTLLSAAQDIGTYFAKQAEPETCTWQQDGDSDSGFYGTSCGHYFDITDGTPEDNKMQWCCYCGKKLTQALITEDEDD